MVTIGSLMIASLVITGCDGTSKTQCHANGASPPPSSCVPAASETSDSRPTFQTIEKNLEAGGYSRLTSDDVSPSTWNKGDTTIVVGKDLSGSVKVRFPAQGEVHCTHLGGDPSGPNPMRLAHDLKSMGYGLARTTLGCSGL